MNENPEALLADACAELYADPLGWVMMAFEWGSDELTGFDGPDDWQRDYLRQLGKQIEDRGFDGVTPCLPIQMSTASGHGIGKSTLVAWLILFIMSTRPFAKGVVTATTYPQLRTKTWGELAKWKKRCITGHWFTITAGQTLSIYHQSSPDSWRCDGQTCREENSDSFAGLHAANSTPFYIFDEASGVPDAIEAVSRGGLTDGEPMVHVFGNPTKNSGFFHEITFGRRRSGWLTRSIDSRQCKMTNKELLNRWAVEHGEDSDFFRVRVRGMPPSAGDVQFIPRTLVQQARVKEAQSEEYNPWIIGVDVARYGAHRSVIVTRRGRDARTVRPKVFRNYSTTQLADEIVLHAQGLGHHNIGAIFIDGGGVGGGVIDRCRQLGLDVIEINFATRMPAGNRHYNMRAHMYGELKSWMVDGGAIEDSNDLETELVALEFGYHRNNQILLEPKDDIVKRLGDDASPDHADALALTFAHPVGPTTLAYPDRRTPAEIQRVRYDPVARFETKEFGKG